MSAQGHFFRITRSRSVLKATHRERRLWRLRVPENTPHLVNYMCTSHETGNDAILAHAVASENP
jgi:hypothetical protein